ncbi:hypothetical protein NMY22_g19069 [Coprinellus aureogranulatus]|nr:hypothetical protein NMY22_g19069 [Coprinellus aureogranulatus]
MPKALTTSKNAKGRKASDSNVYFQGGGWRASTKTKEELATARAQRCTARETSKCAINAEKAPSGSQVATPNQQQAAASSPVRIGSVRLTARLTEVPELGNEFHVKSSACDDYEKKVSRISEKDWQDEGLQKYRQERKISMDTLEQCERIERGGEGKVSFLLNLFMDRFPRLWVLSYFALAEAFPHSNLANATPDPRPLMDSVRSAKQCEGELDDLGSMPHILPVRRSAIAIGATFKLR